LANFRLPQSDSRPPTSLGSRPMQLAPLPLTQKVSRVQKQQQTLVSQLQKQLSLSPLPLLKKTAPISDFPDLRSGLRLLHHGISGLAVVRTASSLPRWPPSLFSFDGTSHLRCLSRLTHSLRFARTIMSLQSWAANAAEASVPKLFSCPGAAFPSLSGGSGSSPFGDLLNLQHQRLAPSSS
jgi:hypothetical protein